MERFVVREPRVGADYPQGNQMLAFSSNTGPHNNPRNMIPETMYFGGYGAEFPVARSHSQGFMGMTHVNAPYPPNQPGPNQVMSGIDPRYLAGYADDNAVFIAGHRQQMQREQNPLAPNGPTFATDYENRTFPGPDRRLNTFTSQMAASSNVRMPSSSSAQKSANSTPAKSFYGQQVENRQSFEASSPRSAPSKPASKTPVDKVEPDPPKPQTQLAVRTRADKLRLRLFVCRVNYEPRLQIKGQIHFSKELHKSGARAFSGPVEKVLKWHKALQDLGVLVLYEIVAKCVSIRAGEGCAKTLVVRDDSGPAMQVVYYEIDFLLPELNPPCTIRVMGRMCAGSQRLQAFSVRRAAGDDVATLPRRAAVAAHHVAKLCREYGVSD